MPRYCCDESMLRLLLKIFVHKKNQQQQSLAPTHTHTMNKRADVALSEMVPSEITACVYLP